MARTFQNIRLFHNMTALENVMVAMHSRIKGGVWASIIRTPACAVRRRARATRRSTCSSSPACGGARVNTRRTCPTGTSAGSRSRARWRPIRSCCSTSRRQNEPGGDGQFHRLRREAPAGAGHDDPAHRARHARRDGNLGPCDGARLRREDRRGLEGSSARRARHRGVPRHAGHGRRSTE